MKRTVSVNIKGMNFLIEEDAYELLQDYMDRLSHSLRNEKGSKEIIEDIELRIAELCSSKLTEKKTVIEIEDIQSILATLGDPAQYLDEDAEPSEEFSSKAQSTTQTKERHLFRDMENAKIAGVCGGIANFFNIDVVVIRALFVLVFFFGGFGFPLYVILWVVVPKANSTIDKLRMRGKAVTVESVRDEVESAAKRFEGETKSFANRLRNDENYTDRFSSIGRFITVAVGAGFILFALFLLFMFLVFVISGMQFIPVQSETGFLSLSELGELVLNNSSDHQWAWIGGLMAGFSSIFFILLLGTKIMFRIKTRWSKLTLGMLFTIGFIGTIICVVVGAKAGRDMAVEGEIEREVGSVFTEQLIVISHESAYRKMKDFHVKSDGNYGMIGLYGESIQESGIHFQYRASKDSLFHVYQNLSAHNHSHRTATEKAKHIKHSMQLENKYLHVNTYYRYPKADKLRDQEVYVVIEIPEGKSVKINKQVIRMGSDEFEEKNMDELYEEDGYLKNNGEYKHHD